MDKMKYMAPATRQTLAEPEDMMTIGSLDTKDSKTTEPIPTDTGSDPGPSARYNVWDVDEE